jgi:hypothetical protein
LVHPVVTSSGLARFREQVVADLPPKSLYLEPVRKGSPPNHVKRTSKALRQLML